MSNSLCTPGGRHWLRVPPALTKRVRAFIIDVGPGKARVLLRVGPVTLDELRDEGKLRPDVVARVEARLTELGA